MSAFPLTAAAFPDFDVSTFPAMPEGFAESSYANDTCPSFWNEALKLSIHVDYEDSSMREFEDGERFHLIDTETGDSVISSDDFAVIESTVAEIRAQLSVKDEATARAFLKKLHEDGLAYHPEDRANDCLRDANLSPARIQAIQIDMRACFSFVDPCGVLIDILEI